MAEWWILSLSNGYFDVFSGLIYNIANDDRCDLHKQSSLVSFQEECKGGWEQQVLEQLN